MRQIIPKLKLFVDFYNEPTAANFEPIKTGLAETGKGLTVVSPVALRIRIDKKSQRLFQSVIY